MMNKQMKKLVVTGMMAISLVAGASAVADAKEAPIISLADIQAITTTAEAPSQGALGIGIAKVNLAINVNTLVGDDVSGFYGFTSTQEIYDFLVGEDVTRSIRCFKSNKPRRNQVICSENTAVVLGQIAQAITNDTETKIEGPRFSIQALPTEFTPEMLKALSDVGIQNPVLLEITSSKKVQAGGWFGKTVAQAQPVMQTLDAISNFANIRNMFRGF